MHFGSEQGIFFRIPVKRHNMAGSGKRFAGIAIGFLCILTIFGVCRSVAGPVFKDADINRVLVFPRDHGRHSDFETEWWYFTGNLESPDNKWGFQLTFFRRSLLCQRPSLNSSWAVRDVYPAHFALTDITNGRFYQTELVSREGPGLAGASEDDLRVRVRDWVAEWRGGEIHIRARQNGYSLDLRLRPEKEKVLHGQGGYSRKGETAGQASHYYSFTRLRAEGILTFGGKASTVSGLAWMDHEFGSGILLPHQTGWDWFSLQFDDGTEVMVFHMSHKDGSLGRPFGTFVPAEGDPVDLAGKEISISAKGSWLSPHTRTRYPSGWTIDIPEMKISLKIEPLFDDQELVTAKSTQIIYWEGAVEVKGVREGKPVRGKGYVELTGYAHPMAGSI